MSTSTATAATAAAGLPLATLFAQAPDRGLLEQLPARLIGSGAALALADAAPAEEFARRAAQQDPAAAQALLAALEPPRSEAARWLSALLMEAMGRPAQAAAHLAGLGAGGGDSGALYLLARTRQLQAAGDWDAAWAPLRQAIKSTDSYRLLRQAARLLKAGRRHAQSPCQRRLKIALEGTVTLDLLAPVLDTQCFAAGIEATVHVGPFNQIDQQILDPNSNLARFAPDVVVLLADTRSLGLNEATEPAGAADIVARLRPLWQQCRERLGAFVLQCNFEIPAVDPLGRLSAASPRGHARFLHALNQALWEEADRQTGLAVFDLEQTAANFGKLRWSDPVLWQAAKQHPAPEALPVLGRELTATLRAITGLTAKCLVLDLDGTLWGGVIGEDGLQGIALGGTPAGEAFVAFQRYVKALAGRGILLAVCSKNNEADARLPFREHPEMVLREEDIAVFVANWEPKDENLRRIASTINIGLDSLVLADDNPAERGRVRQNLPQVEVVELPSDPSLYAAAIHRLGVFEALSVTAEDRQRTASIRQNLERQALEHQTGGDLDAYLAGLEMQVELFPFDEANLPRIVQLINKTNQFNLTTRRLSESDVRRMMSEPGWYTQAMRTRDRFGDSGLTGVLIGQLAGGSAHVHTWLMSCRILGRRIEEMMFAAAERHARAQGCQQLTAEYLPTAKNGLVADLYDRLGLACVETAESGARRYARALDSQPPFPTPAVGQCRDLTNQEPLS